MDVNQGVEAAGLKRFAYLTACDAAFIIGYHDGQARMDNVVACPHMGGLDEESLTGMAQLAARNIVDLYRGQWPGGGRIANPEVRDRWTW